MKIYAENKEKKIIKQCFNFFPQNNFTNNLRYIMNVDYLLLPKTVYYPFDESEFSKVKDSDYAGYYCRYDQNDSDIYYQAKDTELYLRYTIIHELAHHLFFEKELLSKWTSLFKYGNKFVSEYAKQNIEEFFAENYVFWTFAEGRNWIIENRPDVASSLEKIYVG